jgi:sarcosine dehydrogenase
MAVGIGGIESHIVSPAEAKEIHPLMNVDDLVGAIYTPSDGHIDPTALVTAYTTAAKQHGASTYEGVSVTSIEQAGGAVTGLTTACGQTIKTPVIVNCTGAWARKIGGMAGVDLPLLAYKHAYAHCCYLLHANNNI